MDSYERFCEAFQSEGEPAGRAELVLLLRDWMNRVCGEPEEGTGLDQLLEGRTDFDKPGGLRKDALSRVAEASLPPFRLIAQHMREKIQRENVKLPVHKVREVSGSGMVWLSRYPGDTVRQKLNSAKGMLAVQRRMSLDTGENRLFLAFLRELADLLALKLEARPDPEEEDYLGQILAFLRREDLGEIRRWENLPPNNTLLSDPQYRKIWSGWNALKQLDECVRQDYEHLPERMCTLFFVEFLRQLRGFATLPQLPVRLDYEQYQIDPQIKHLFALDGEGQRLELRRERSCLEIHRPSGSHTVRFTQERIDSSVDGASYTLSRQGLVMCLEDLLFALHGEGLVHSLPAAPAVCPKAAVDPFALYPACLALDQEGEASVLPERIMMQEYRTEGAVYQLPCGGSKGIILSENTECCTIHSAMEAEERAGRQLNRLAGLLASRLAAGRLTFLFPDIYTDFQLSLLQQGLRVAYPNVRSLPRSIGAAFFCQSQPGFSGFFQDNGFLLLLDLVGGELTMTLVQGKRLENPGARSLVWERYPTMSVPLPELGDLTDRLYRDGCQEAETVFRLLGLQGLREEAEKGLTFFFPEGGHYTLKNTVMPKAPLLDVSNHVDRFLNQCRNIVGGAPVYLYSFSRSFRCGKSARRDLRLRYLDSRRALEGCRTLARIQNRTDVPLWQDHLPELSIKLLHGAFPLIRQKSVMPKFGRRERLEVPGSFILPRSSGSVYQFDLIQSNMNRRSQFVAVVNSPAFPLREDVECRLELWYQYGEENPFRLLFCPLDPARAGFVQANVTWKPRSEVPYPSKNLPAPKAPPAASWQAMEQYQGKQETVNIPEELTRYFKNVQEGYKYLDLSGYPVELTGEPGKRTFTYKGDLDGEAVSLYFSEEDLDKYARDPVNMAKLSGVSFQLRKRYRCRLTPNGRTGKLWSLNSKMVMFHTEQNVEIDGERCQVLLFEDRFDGEFRSTIDVVTFEAGRPKRFPDGTLSYLAFHIRDAGEETYPSFRAVSLRTHNRPASWIYSGKASFLMLSAFPLRLPDGPPELWKAFCRARETWMDMYEDCGHPHVKNSLFGLMSLTACDLGDRYYEFAEQRVRDFEELNRNRCWSDRIGYALYACKLEREQKLLKQLCGIRDKDSVVRVLSKAVWGHPDFILNVPPALLLEYFYTAVEYVRKLHREWDGKRGSNQNYILTGIQSSFEYCLGVFRLRSLGDAELNERLSMNSPKVFSLYKYTELIIDGIDRKEPLHTFLKLTIPDKKQYAGISDLAYAMLVYITGREEGDAIQISGISNQDGENAW
ncbi:DUF2357 domain-containing protein [Oscillospiraceae bacterium 38-13]